MAFRNSFNTYGFEVRGIADSSITLETGMAVKFKSLPIPGSTPLSYSLFIISTATPTDEVFGVVSTNETTVITDIKFGRVVLVNAFFIPVLMDENASRGDYVKVKTMNGKFGKCVMGDISEAQLVEDVKKDELVWAKTIRIKV